jgi:hypothetical protein
MISVIICSVNKVLREQIKININETIGIDHEVIIIENDIHHYPIAKAYNIGAHDSKFPYLCFCHEDILFHTLNWGQILIENFQTSGARLIGVLGCEVKVKHPSSVYLGESGLNHQNHLQRHPSKPTYLCYENPYNERLSEVCILDGLFIASTKAAWEETKFSEEYLTGFHGYDIDYSLKNFLRGKVMVTYEVLLEHFSHGSYNHTWVYWQLKVTEKWRNKLPLYTSRVTKNLLKKAELLNLKEWLKVLLALDYQPAVQWKYVLHHIARSPWERINLYNLRRIILRNKLNEGLRSFVKPAIQAVLKSNIYKNKA